MKDIIPKFDLGNEENAEIWTKLFTTIFTTIWIFMKKKKLKCVSFEYFYRKLKNDLNYGREIFE